MSILGIDYGDKKIGLAKSAGSLAVPLMILENKGNDFILKKIKEVCESESVNVIVVGVPTSLGGGKESNQHKKVLDFIGTLSSLHITIIQEDERLSTKMAKNISKNIKNRGDDDATSAMLILQNYLDKNENLISNT